MPQRASSRRTGKRSATELTMSAFNWIEASCRCPACKAGATLRAQTHVASSFDGTEQGRFSGRTYRLGEQMAWWPSESPLHAAWLEGRDPAHRPLAGEACYAECQRCHAELCVVVEFEDLKPVRIIQVSLASEWPVGYLR
jgi:hypothetical protein